jgi:hypothetical protein
MAPFEDRIADIIADEGLEESPSGARGIAPAPGQDADLQFRLP